MSDASEVKRWLIPVGEKFALVDEDDYAFLSRYTWTLKPSGTTWYAHTTVYVGGKRVGIGMHRFLTQMRNTIVDHRNCDGLDNRKQNLRFATVKQNAFNRPRKNKLGYRGVFKDPSGKFGAQIQAYNKKKHVRGFATAEDAARAYDKMAKELHGEFALLNFK